MGRKSVEELKNWKIVNPKPILIVFFIKLIWNLSCKILASCVFTDEEIFVGMYWVGGIKIDLFTTYVAPYPRIKPNKLVVAEGKGMVFWSSPFVENTAISKGF